MRGRRRSSTLILVLIVATLLSLLAFSTGNLARHASLESLAERERTLKTYAAEAALEALRLQLVRHFETSGMAPRTWLRAIQHDHNYRVYGVVPKDAVVPVEWGTVAAHPLSPPPGSAAVGVATYTQLPGVRAWIDRVSLERGWLELVAGTLPTHGEAPVDRRAALSIRLRLSIFRNAIFDLALVAETINCMFCHLHVRGDVGSISNFRPGLGTENGKGRYTGAGSVINGSVYVGGLASDDSDWHWSNNVLEDPRLINAARVVGGVFQNYRGPYLPSDTIGHDGVPDFPSFDPARIERRALSGGGSIKVERGSFGGTFREGEVGMWIVPMGRDWSAQGKPGTGAIRREPESTSVIDGNLVILGSEIDLDPPKPILIDGNIYVRGDVIIRGAVSGRGAIYAGRNMYVVGDVRYLDSPGSGYPLFDDQAGVDAIQEGTSELRLAARGSVVIGDWTYASDDGKVRRVAKRQGQDFMNAQFDLGRVRFYEATNDGSTISNELRQDPTSGRFFNDNGEPIPPDRVARFQTSQIVGNTAPLDAPRYDAVIAPGVVVRRGELDEVGEGWFKPWITQEQFRLVLGRKPYNLITFRVPAQNNPAHRMFELGQEWVAEHGALLPRSVKSDKRRIFDAGVLEFGHVGMLVCGGFNDELWRGALISEKPEAYFAWATQVEHIDAFVFASRRIAGKTDRGYLTVNGGLAAAEVGVLAPGHRNVFIKNAQLTEGSDKIPEWVFSTYRKGHADHPRNDYGHLSSNSRIYYDYRLRNGGYGFDFLASMGDSMFYTREGRASPPRNEAFEGVSEFPLR